MYQITDGTFAEARRYCVHDHVVVEDGPWDDWNSCWFNGLYTRVVVTHAVELMSAYLDRNIANTLKRLRIASATLAAEAGSRRGDPPVRRGTGEIFARRRFRLAAGQRCGDHVAQAYVSRVNALKRVFRELGDKD